MHPAWPLLILLALAPAGAAGSLEIGPVDAPQDPIVPDTGSAAVTVPVRIDCQAALEWTGYGVLEPSVRLDLSWVPEDPGVVVTGAMAKDVPVEPCVQGEPELNAEVPLEVQVSHEAPGERPLRVDLTLEASTGAATGPEGDEGRAATAFVVVADYLGVLRAHAPTTIKHAGPGKEISFPVELVNFGNSYTAVSFSVQDGEVPEGWQVVLPSPVILARSGADMAQDVTLRVATPRSQLGSQDVTFQLVATPISTQDMEKRGAAVTVNVLAGMRPSLSGSDPADAARGGDEGEAAPGSGALVPALVLGAVAAAVRLRRARRGP